MCVCGKCSVCEPYTKALTGQVWLNSLVTWVGGFQQPNQRILYVCLVSAVSIPSMVSVAEEGGTVQVCATLNTPVSIGADVTVTLATSDDTGTMLKHSTVHSQCESSSAAIAGSDYVSVSMDVVFPAGTSNGGMQCIDVTIIDDSEMEGDETFTVALSTSSPVVTFGNAVTLENAVTTITITDNDGECMYSYIRYIMVETTRDVATIQLLQPPLMLPQLQQPPLMLPQLRQPPLMSLQLQQPYQYTSC